MGEVLTSPAHHEVAGRVRRWVAGKPEAEHDHVRVPARDLLVRVVLGELEPGGQHDLAVRIAVHGALEISAGWHFESALSCVLMRHEDPWPDLAEAMALRVLAHALGCTRPAALASHDDATIGLALCDDLVLGLGHGARIMAAFRARERRPQLGPGSVVQLAHHLHAMSTHVPVDADLFDTPLVAPHAALLATVRADADAFGAALTDACEFRLSRSGLLERELCAETDMLVPSELLAVLVLRRRLGLEVPATPHPLLAPFLQHPSRTPAELRSALLDQLEWRFTTAWL